MFDKIVMEGDVPVNLGVVGLVAHTYTLTGDDKYRTWIADYVEAWMDRIGRTGGSFPTTSGSTAASAATGRGSGGAASTAGRPPPRTR